MGLMLPLYLDWWKNHFSFALIHRISLPNSERIFWVILFNGFAIVMKLLQLSCGKSHG